MAVMQGIKSDGTAGAYAVTAAGAMPVLSPDDGDDSLERLLLRVIMELRELRKVACKQAGVLFIELQDQV